MEFLSETRKGYKSSFSFRCKMCNDISTITSENSNVYFPINKAIVNGSLAMGNKFRNIYSYLSLMFFSVHIF